MVDDKTPPPPSSSDAAGEDGGPPPPPPPDPRHSVLVHSLLEQSRSSHGLRHDDHSQYRSYCTRKLSRLRHARPVRRELSHSTAGTSDRHKKGGRHAFRSHDGRTAEDSMKHVNYLLVELYQAERAWSHALEMKGLYDAAKSDRGKSKSKPSRQQQGRAASAAGGKEKGRSSPGKIRNHYLRKLKKASEFATSFEAMAEASGDERTRVEARAYGGWMRGNWSLEVGDWKTACAEYGSALAICRTLGSGRDGAPEDLETRDFFTARAERVLEPLVRYCRYELKESGAVGNADEFSFSADDDDDVLSLMKSPQLRSKLDSIRDEKLRGEASAGSMSAIRFRGHDVPVENSNLRIALLKVEELKSDVERSEDDEGRNDAKFLALLSGYDDATSVVAADLKEYKAMKAGPAVNAKVFELESLLGYVRHGKLKLLMNRNERMVDDLREAERRAVASPPSKSKGGGGASSSADAAAAAGGGLKRVEEIAHLYDALLQDARAVADLPGGRSPSDEAEGGGGGGPVEDEFVLEARANALRLRAYRCHYLARMHASDSVGKYREAAALFERAEALAAESTEEIAACQDMEGADSLIEGLEGLEREIRAAKVRAEARACLTRSGGGGGGGGGGAASAAGAAGPSLLRRLDDFDAGGAGRSKLADVPPALIPIPCKPTFFDVALNHAGEMPMAELQGHIDRNRPQSKGLLGWFRRG